MVMQSKRKHDKSRHSGNVQTDIEGSKFPDHLRREHHLYIEGVILSQAHGKYKVRLDNGMESLATASKMRSLKVGLLEGDRVVCAIDMRSLSPGETLRSRIVWRNK